MNNEFTFTDYQHRFNHLYDKIERLNFDESENFYDFLKQINFFTCPSSSQYHGAKEGGLLEHSVIVAETMLKLREALAPELSEESCILVALLHDVGKATYYNQDLYIPNMVKGKKKGEGMVQSEAKPYKHSDRLEIPHAMASLHIISKFMPLTIEETQAILAHNGLYVGSGREFQNKEHPLTYLLHVADMWASRYIETGTKPESSEVMF